MASPGCMVEVPEDQLRSYADFSNACLMLFASRSDQRTGHHSYVNK